MTNQTKRCLFGGALLAAGLAFPAAAQFDFSSSWGYSYARAYPDLAFDQDMFNGAGPFSIASDMSNAYSSAHGDLIFTPTTAGAHASVSGAGGYAWGSTLSYFTVGSDITATVTWEWSQTHGYLWIYDLTDSQTIFDMNGSGNGSTPLSLVQSHEYQILGYSVAGGEGNRSTFWEVSIPAPGSAGLLGLAGLAACRRTQRCPVPAARPHPRTSITGT